MKIIIILVLILAFIGYEIYDFVWHIKARKKTKELHRQINEQIESLSVSLGKMKENLKTSNKQP